MVVSMVAFQGERGAYSEMAALQRFPNTGLLPLRSFQDVFDALKSGKANFAVVPVENSIEGSVNEIYDLLMHIDNIQVTGEIYQRVKHCLIANKGSTLDRIKSVYSHHQALAQCRNYLQKNHLNPIQTYDTAGSVKMIKEKKMLNVAAIASKLAAHLYEMEILEQGIEDRKNNFTRFLVLSQTDTDSRAKKTRKRKERSRSKKTDRNDHGIVKEKKDNRQPTGQNKTSIIFSVNHVPGALFGILKEFAHRKINLTKIESRPTKETPWEYNFYMDFEGHVKDKSVMETLQSINEKTSFVKILGSYKKAEFT